MLEPNAAALFARFLELLEAGEGPDFEAFVRDHPAEGAELRRLHGEWRASAAGHVAAWSTASDEETVRREPGSLARRLTETFGPDIDPHVTLRGAAEHGADFSDEVLARLADRKGTFGRYQIKGRIGHGGMGEVLKIWDEDLHRHLAMKVILEQAATTIDKADVARFLEEAQVTGQLDHPGIVPVHELGLDPQGRVYFTMKLVKGVTLEHVFKLAKRGDEGWTQTRVLGVLLKVCEAMAYAHDKGVIHRDLKPGNVMVGKFGEVHVMDWGIARILDQEDRRDIRIREEPALRSTQLRSERDDHRGETPDSPLYTMDGQVVGTPSYMPPEQAAARIEEMGPHSDVYSMGAMLYHLLAGHRPYVPESAFLNNYAVWGLVQQGPPTPIANFAQGTPAELVAICEKAMARDWKQRYPDISALAADLSAYLEHRVVGAHETGAWAETKKWIERNKPLAASLAAGVLALVVGLIVSLSLQRKAEAENSNVLRLSAFQALDDLTKEADEMWPADPDMVARYEAWMRKADDLVGKIPEFRASLAEMQARIPAQGEQEQERGLTVRWWHAQMEKLLASLAAFADPESGMIEGRSADHGLGVAQRREFASSVQERTMAGADATRRWSEALAAIAKSEKYRASVWPGGKPLAPQLGLLPIGTDPDSGLWEFADLQTGVPAERGADQRLVLKEQMGLVLVLIPGGSFWMGEQSENPQGHNYDPAAEARESSVHELNLAPFFLSKYEMTQAQWLRFTGANPSLYRPPQFMKEWSHDGRDWNGLQPVEQVNWLDCDAQLGRLGLVLPTEAQWEYAARAGKGTRFWNGDASATLKDVGNVADAYAKKHSGGGWALLHETWDDGNTSHADVGSYRANPFGLHDVHGNNWEWCRDWLGPYTLPTEGPAAERQVPDGSSRVVRGGAFDTTAWFARSANRFSYQPQLRNFDVGVRPARLITP